MTRLRCCIPFCRRTFADDGSSEVICGKHWRQAPKAWRRRHTKFLRRYRKHHGDRLYWDYPAGSEQRRDCRRLAILVDRLWDRCKAAAIEAAGGI
ncbi:hypothetical protein ACETRX_04155 [Labrys portucalensis]|uniref:HNH endonuclease n=1 Tax=Labrys neptuniae TaxID=376174 RepID=A0ABV6Z9F7_9HYPH